MQKALTVGGGHPPPTPPPPPRSLRSLGLGRSSSLPRTLFLPPPPPPKIKSWLRQWVLTE